MIQITLCLKDCSVNVTCFLSFPYLFWFTVNDEQVAPLCLAPGSAGAPGEHARGEVVALVLKQSPGILTLFADPFC